MTTQPAFAPAEWWEEGVPYSSERPLSVDRLFDAIGPFDVRPSLHRDDLRGHWWGRVALCLLHAPRAAIVPWLHRLGEHRTGTALVPAWTGDAWFHDLVLRDADAVLFLGGKLGGNATERALDAPVVVVAYGMEDAWCVQQAVKDCRLPGRLIPPRGGAESVVTAERRRSRQIGEAWSAPSWASSWPSASAAQGFSALPPR